MDNCKDAFLKAIQQDKYDWDTRKIFADWLEDNGLDDEATYQREWTPAKQRKLDAQEWLEDFATKHEMTYKEVIKCARDMQDAESYSTGSRSAQEAMEDDVTCEKFWECWGLVTEEVVENEFRRWTCGTCIERHLPH